MIYIFGAGGFGRETLNIYLDLNKNEDLKGFVEENSKRKGQIINDLPIYDIEDLQPDNNTKIIIAIGTPLRKRIIKELQKKGFEFDTVVHSSTIMSKWVKIGKGSIITAGNVFTSQINIKEHVIVNLSCTIGHDVTINDFSTISPGVNISGKVNIGKQTFIGTGAIIVEGVNIGNRTFIGAGSVVTKDIPDDVLAHGNPAKIIKKLSSDDWKKLI